MKSETLRAPSWGELSKTVVYSPYALGHFRLREFLSVALFIAAMLAVFGASVACLAGHPAADMAPAGLAAAIHGAALAGLACIAWGVLVEPYQLALRRVVVESPRIRRPLRALHLSDLHVREWSRVEEGILAGAKELLPNVIFLTGDYLATPGSIEALERLLKGLARLAPVYASLGNGELLDPVHRQLHIPGLTWLTTDCRALVVDGTPLRVYGIRPGDERNFWQAGRGTRPGEFAVCLYHFPDFAPELARIPYDLMLCGHTHGGQIRLPWLGALVSLTRAGTAYARGVFRSGAKTAVVTQGVGCEAYGLPRMRFLCPPELVVLELRPAP